MAHSSDEIKRTQEPLDIKICPAVLADIPAIAAIEAASFPDPWSEKGLEDCLKYSFSTMLTARLGERIVGFCCLYQVLSEGEIVNVAIDPKFRSRGIGRQMLDGLLSLGKDRGVTRFLLDVRLSNAPAIALYEKAGFKTLTIQKNFYSNPVEHGWLMELVVGE